MDVTLALLADAANISREGKLNILGAFANIYARTYPSRHPEMQLVLRLAASPGEVGQTKDLQIVLVDADGKRVEDFHLTGKFEVPASKVPGRRSQMETIVRLIGVTFPREGDYTFDIMVGGESKALIPLSLSVPPTVIRDEGDDGGN